MTYSTRSRTSGKEERCDGRRLPEINSTRKNRVFTRQKDGFFPSKSGFFRPACAGQADDMATSVEERHMTTFGMAHRIVRASWTAWPGRQQQRAGLLWFLSDR